MPDAALAPQAAPDATWRRVATIDWMRGLVMVLMVLMVIDHASMAFDRTTSPGTPPFTRTPRRTRSRHSRSSRGG